MELSAVEMPVQLSSMFDKDTVNFISLMQAAGAAAGI